MRALFAAWRALRAEVRGAGHTALDDLVGIAALAVIALDLILLAAVVPS